jgi:hypothetical protein
MIKRPSLPLVLLVLSICFVAGLVSVLISQNDDGLPSTPQGMEASSTTHLPGTDATSSPQTTILILGVDQLGTENPQLRAIWFATFRLPGRDVFLFGIPLDLPVAAQPELRLHDLFRWSANQGPDALFMQALYAELPLAIDVILALDEVGFAALIDYMGGVTLESGTLDGNQVIGVLELVEDQPRAALEVQGRLVRALRDKAPELGSTPDLSPLMALIPEHAFSSIPAINVVAMINPLLPIQSETVHIEIMIGE